MHSLEGNTSGVQIRLFDNYELLSQAAAQVMSQAVVDKPGLLVCAASGGSPKRAYDLWVEQLNKQGLGQSMRLMSLDEWEGVDQGNPVGSSYQIYNQIAKPLGLRDTLLINGLCNDTAAEIAKVNDYLAQNGPIDLCIVGVGSNGHLGLNEPAESLSPVVHRSLLTEESRRHPMLANAGFLPEYGITLGVGNILAAKKILFLVNGVHKKDIMQQWVRQQVSTSLPASFLWLHPNVTCFCDREAWPV